MQTSGKVILNARGVNINGYDCFVNLSKDTKNEYCDYKLENESQYGDPLSGFQVLCKTNALQTKISPSSLNIQNCIRSYIYYSNKPDYIHEFNVGTLCFWLKKSMLSNNTPVPSLNSRTTLSIRQDTEIFYNSNTKRAIILGTSGQWVSVNHNVNFMDNNWHHFCVCKNGNRMMIFIDGNAIFDRTESYETISGWVNMLVLSSLYTTDYYDDIVLIDGEALWTSNFTPPSTYLLDSEYAMDLDQVRRRNIITANVDKKYIIPDEDVLKQY